ncbi:universal stress protein [Nocardia exalbida]|uniref:universal stress protein n=1 Tax=Nocardia exalbida TaxID=290231 RepID=UPI0009FC5E26
MVGVDGSDGSWAAVRWAAQFAAERGRELEILHGMDLVGTGWVLGDYEVVIPSVIDAIREQGEDVVARACRRAGIVRTAPGICRSGLSALSVRCDQKRQWDGRIQDGGGAIRRYRSHRMNGYTVPGSRGVRPCAPFEGQWWCVCRPIRSTEKRGRQQHWHVT